MYMYAQKQAIARTCRRRLAIIKYLRQHCARRAADKNKKKDRDTDSEGEEGHDKDCASTAVLATFLQNTAAVSNTLPAEQQHTATHSNTQQQPSIVSNTLPQAATYQLTAAATDMAASTAIAAIPGDDGRLSASYKRDHTRDTSFIPVDSTKLKRKRINFVTKPSPLFVTGSEKEGEVERCDILKSGSRLSSGAAGAASINLIIPALGSLAQGQGEGEGGDCADKSSTASVRNVECKVWMCSTFGWKPNMQRDVETRVEGKSAAP